MAHRWFFAPPWLSNVALGLALVGVAYWPALSSPFLFDSIPAIAENSGLTFHGHTLADWYAAVFSSSAGPSGRPLAMFTFALNAASSGVDDVFAFRLTNLTIHATNALLVAILVSHLMRRIADHDLGAGRFGANPISVGTLAGGTFLFHTLQLTAVLHDVQRMVLLATTFQLLAVLVYLRGRSVWTASGSGRVRACNDLTLIALLCLLGFLSKENALLTPLLLLVVEAFWFSANPRFVLFLAFAVPALSLSAWLLLGGMDILREMYSNRSFGLEDRLMTEARVLWIYLYWFVCPAALSAGWNHDDISVSRAFTDPWVALALAGWVVMACVMFLTVGRKGGLRLVGFAIAWFLVSHLMESTVVPLEIAFEHRNYVALFGLVMAVSFLFVRMADLLPGKTGVALPVLAMLMLWGLLFMRALAWQNPLSLAVFSLAERPGSFRSKSDLAEATFNRALQTDDKELAVVARDSYERLTADAPGELLPLARLIEIESILGNKQRLDMAVMRLVEALHKPQLSIQDGIGLRLVEQCAAARQCVTPAAVDRIFSTLAKRPDADPTALTLTRVRIALGASGNARDAIDRLGIGPALASYSSGQLIEIAVWHGMAGERAPALEAIRLAIAADKMRLRTAALRRLYAAPTAG